MSPIEARAIADETIAYWLRPVRPHRRMPLRPTAREVYQLVTGNRYPGGGWERARAAMVDWLLAQDASDFQRAA